jgi:hypothetical protein
VKRNCPRRFGLETERPTRLTQTRSASIAASLAHNNSEAMGYLRDNHREPLAARENRGDEDEDEDESPFEGPLHGELSDDEIDAFIDEADAFILGEFPQKEIDAFLDGLSVEQEELLDIRREVINQELLELAQGVREIAQRQRELLRRMNKLRHTYVKLYKKCDIALPPSLEEFLQEYGDISQSCNQQEPEEPLDEAFFNSI